MPTVTGMYSMYNYYLLVYITEEEMMALDNADMRKVDGGPVYYTVTKYGAILIWPKFDPQKHSLMCKVEKLG
jgi:hypothetical protein